MEKKERSVEINVKMDNETKEVLSNVIENLKKVQELLDENVKLLNNLKLKGD